MVASCILTNTTSIVVKTKKQDAINRSNAQIQAQIDRKTDQYRALDAKFFKTSAEKAEMARLQREIAELKSQLS